MENSKQITKRKPGRPKVARSETKIKILQIGSLLFMEIGYDKASLELVAKRCGITKASVYYYYTNKALLFTECILYVLGLAYTGTIKILEQPIPLKEKLYLIALRQMSNAHLDFESMMRDASKELNDEQIALIRGAENKLIQELITLFEQSIKNGELTKEHSPTMLAHYFTSLFSMKNHLNLKSRKLEDVVTEAIHIFWIGAKA